mmetsp:Transcript_17403/g.34901  ORF Transcript_17403/g.34901 Transcript_17403/m.34901 type:complete len:128 (+) Transcript_17403:325-708(+)
MPPVVRTRGADASEEGVPRKRYTEPSSSSSRSLSSASASKSSSGGVEVPEGRQFYSMSQVKSLSDSKAPTTGTTSKKKRSADGSSSKGGSRPGKKAKHAGASGRIRTPHDHDVLSGRGGGKSTSYRF